MRLRGDRTRSPGLQRNHSHSELQHSSRGLQVFPSCGADVRHWKLGGEKIRAVEVEGGMLRSVHVRVQCFEY